MNTHILAKGRNRASLYSTRETEMCEGTEGLTADEAQELIQEWKRMERDEHGYVVTDYLFVSVGNI